MHVVNLAACCHLKGQASGGKGWPAWIWCLLNSLARYRPSCPATCSEHSQTSLKRSIKDSLHVRTSQGFTVHESLVQISLLVYLPQQPRVMTAINLLQKRMQLGQWARCVLCRHDVCSQLGESTSAETAGTGNSIHQHVQVCFMVVTGNHCTTIS